MLHPEPAGQWTEQEYIRFRDLAAWRFGLQFPPQRRADLAARVAEAMAGSGFTDLDAYFRTVSTCASPSTDLSRLADALTVGETYFFRTPSHFDALTRHILPALIRARAGTSRRLRLWSCGCSTGEEPYSLAIALLDLLGDLAGWDVRILGTDLNQGALERAREAVYGAWSFRELSPSLQNRYFQPQGDRWRLHDEVRRLVTFRHHNLADEPYPHGPGAQADLILCRNVTIYFSPELTQSVVDRLHDGLAPGGWLLVGPSEPNLHTYRRFQYRTFDGAIFYQRSETPPRPPHTTQTGAKPPQAPHRTASAVRPLPSAKAKDPLWRQASLAADRGDLEAARRLAAEAVTADGLTPESHYTLALICQELGAWDEAVHALKRALFLDRKIVAAHVLLGSICARTGMPAQARKAFANAADLLKHLPEAEPVPLLEGATAAQLLAMLERNPDGGEPCKS